MNTSKLKAKDIITVTLLTLINVVIFFISSFLYALPITIVLMPIFFSLLEGVVYLRGFYCRKRKGGRLEPRLKLSAKPVALC